MDTQNSNLFKKVFPKIPKIFKGLNTPYRMVFVDEETFKEVASFNLTKKSVWTLFSMLFVTTVLLTVLLVLYTPLKYYIPGYGINSTHREVMKIKREVDSLTDLIESQHKQLMDIKNVVSGGNQQPLDTTKLSENLIKESASQSSIVPSTQQIKNQANVK